MRNKTALFLTDVFEVGGIETFLIDFTKQLRKKSIDSTIVTYHSSARQYHSTDTNFVWFNLPKGSLAFKLLQIIKTNLQLYYLHKKHEFAYIFLNTAEITLHCILFLIWIRFLKKNTRIYFQFHGSAKEVWKSSITEKDINISYYVKNWYLSLAEAFSYSISSNILCFSNYSKNILKERKLDNKKMFVLKPGRNILTVKKNSRLFWKKKLGLYPNLPLILFISRLEKRKGMYEFLEIVKELSRHKRVNVVCCSKFNQDLTSTFQFFDRESSLDIGGASIFHVHDPSVDEIISLYSAADLLIQPSITLETFGYTIFEALQLSLPVACFNIGANNELITHKKNGFIREVSESKLLIKDILSYLGDKYIQRVMSKNACQSVELYTWDRYIGELEKKQLL